MKKLPLIIGVILVLSILPLAGGEDGFQIIMTIEDRDYQVGDTINVTIHVFNDGEYVEPDEINVTLGFGMDEQEINITKISTGKYSASFQVSEEDWEKGSILVQVDANYGDHQDNDFMHINFQNEGLRLDVFIHADKMFPVAGDTITITVTVLNNSENADPEEIHLYLEVDYDLFNDFPGDGNHDGEKEELDLTKTGVGEYQATFSIDSEDRISHKYDLTAEVEDGDSHGDSWLSFGSKYYQVWYNRTTITRGDKTIDFGIYVADAEGHVVKGADIWFEYEVVYFSDRNEGTRSGITNDKGYAVFSIPSFKQAEVLVVGGWVNDTYHQKFKSQINFDTIDDLPDESGFDLIFHEEMTPYEPETNVTLQFTAYLDSEPINDLPMYVSVFTDHQVLFYGEIIPDKGNFTLVFTTPAVSNILLSTFVEMEFILNNSGEYLRQWKSISVFDIRELLKTDVEIEVKSMESNRDIELTVNDEQLAGSHALVLVSPYPGEMVNITPENFFEVNREMDENTDWAILNDALSFTLIYPNELEEKDRGIFSGILHVPEFWEDYQNFIVVILMVSPQDENFMHFGAKIIKIEEGNSSSTVDEGEDFIPGFQPIIVCVAVVGSLALHYRTRRKETPK